jgi:uncharacterized membrane protein
MDRNFRRILIFVDVFLYLVRMFYMDSDAGQFDNESGAVDKSQLRSTLFRSSEGRVLLVGVTLAVVYSFWLGFKLVFSPVESQVFLGMTATQVIFGRAAGMAFGYSLGLGQGTVIFISIIVETILVLIMYPLFVFSWQQLLVIKRLKNLFERIRKAAEARKPVVQRYGIIGLFVFVWFPFWMTGPVVGSVIGFMIGLRVWVNIAAVLGGTYIAIVGWAIFLRKFHDTVASYSSYAAMVFMSLLLFIIIVVYLFRRIERDNGKDADHDQE